MPSHTQAVPLGVGRSAGLVPAAVVAAILAKVLRRTVSSRRVTLKQLARHSCRMSELELQEAPHEVMLTMLQVVLRPYWRH